MAFGRSLLAMSVVLLTLVACSGDHGAIADAEIESSCCSDLRFAGVDSGRAATIFEYGLIGAYPISPLLQASVAAGIYPAAVVTRSGQVYVVDSESRSSERAALRR